MRTLPLALLLLAAPACKPMLYPAARAFGSPSESYFKDCRAAFNRLKSNRADLRVHPAVDPRRPLVHAGTAEPAVARLRQAGWARCEAVPAAPTVEPTPLGHNQLRYLWTRARAYGTWLAGEPRDGGGRICLEVLTGPGGQVFAAHIFVLEPSGQVAYVRLQNSHHFGPNPPATPEEAVARLVEGFLKDLERPAESVFPPWGIG